ncbi:MAG: transglutaminase-like domain-containing protein, partial [Planctomycetota bacterium]
MAGKGSAPMVESDSRTKSLEARPSADSLVVAIIAISILQVFRWEFQVNILFLIIETLVYLSIPLVWFGMQFQSLAANKADDRSVRIWAQLGAILGSVLPVLVQLIARRFGIGDAYEVVIFLAVQNAAWFLTIFSWQRSFRHAAFVLFSALVLMICFSSDRWQIYAMSVVYFVTSMWWLMGDYWSRIEVKALDGSSSTLPIRTSAIILSALLLMGAGSTAWYAGPITEAVSASGFMPTSGGESWADTYARSGIGDGDMLAAGEDATTTGAVDSDQFIEDNKPSIYDMMSERFDEPVIIKRKDLNRAISLDEQAKHLHNVKQSEQSGRTFRTVRRPKTKKAKKRDFDDRLSRAAFYVEGSVPVRIATDSYNQFDGWDWDKVAIDRKTAMNPPIARQLIDEKNWYVLKNQERKFLKQFRAHKIKLMRLKTNALPAPTLPKSWHIYKVDSENLFSWGEDGLIDMAGEFIPSQTVIDTVSHVPSFYDIRTDPNNLILNDRPSGVLGWVDRLIGAATPLSLLQRTSRISYDPRKGVDKTCYTEVPLNSTRQRLIELAAEWTAGIEPGWGQVEEIVERFRTEFVVDDQNVPPGECKDSISHFLDSGSGPTYLFATAASQVLRAAGYETRLTRGYIVQDDDYHYKSNQSIVTSENLHFWPEVRMEGWHWLPIEPTPGYPHPYSRKTLWQRLASFGNWCLDCIIQRPITVLIAFVLSIASIVFRGEIVSGAIGAIWTMVVTALPRYKLRATRQLMDARFWVAGIPRPKFETVPEWFGQVDKNLSKEFASHWDSANFSGRSSHELCDAEVDRACKKLVSG